MCFDLAGSRRCRSCTRRRCASLAARSRRRTSSSEVSDSKEGGSSREALGMVGGLLSSVLGARRIPRGDRRRMPPEILSAAAGGILAFRAMSPGAGAKV